MESRETPILGYVIPALISYQFTCRFECKRHIWKALYVKIYAVEDSKQLVWRFVLVCLGPEQDTEGLLSDTTEMYFLPDLKPES